MSDTDLDNFPQSRCTDEETVRVSLHKSWDKDVHGPAWPSLWCVRSPCIVVYGELPEREPKGIPFPCQGGCF